MKENTYPTIKIIAWFSILGGAVGGFFVDLMMAINDYPIFHNFDKSFIDFLFGIFFYSFYGIFAELIPTFLTGLIIAKSQVYLSSNAQLGKIFMIGFFVTGILTAIVTLPFLFKEIIHWVKYMICFGVIGGLSSLIVGNLILPKN